LEPELQRHEHGFALPLALIVLAVLAVLSMGLSHMANIQIKQILVKKQQFEGYVATRGAVQMTLFYLLTGQPGGSAFQADGAVIPIDGSPLQLAGLTCRIQDVSGLFALADFNEERFKQLLQRLTDKATAVKLAARLGDWFDKDSNTRYKGMEIADYIAAGLKALPPNRPIRDLDELLEIPGMNAVLFNGDKINRQPGLRDLLTAGGGGGFNAASAPAIVLVPYLQVSDAVAADIVRLREAGDWRRFNELVRSGGQTDWTFPPDMPGSGFRIICKTATGLFSRVQIQINPRDETPYFIQTWQYPDYERF